MNAPLIRTARLDDVDAIVALTRTFHATHLAWDRARWTTALPPHASYTDWIGELLASGDVGGCVLIAEVSGTVGGYLLATVEPESSRHWAPRAIYLHDIFIGEAFRCVGVARRLIERLISWNATVHPQLQIRLMTAAQNDPARAFFARFGFRPCVVEMIRESADRQTPSAE